MRGYAILCADSGKKQITYQELQNEQRHAEKELKKRQEAVKKILGNTTAAKYLNMAHAAANENDNPLIGSLKLAKDSMKSLFVDIKGNQGFILMRDEEESEMFAKAAVLFIITVMINTMIHRAAGALLAGFLKKRGIPYHKDMFDLLTQAIWAPIAGPLVEETAKLIAHRMGILTQFQAIFNMFEFSNYIVKNTTMLAVSGRLNFVNMAYNVVTRAYLVISHHFSSYNLNRDDISEMEAYMVNVFGHFFNNFVASVITLGVIAVGFKKAAKELGEDVPSVTNKDFMKRMLNYDDKLINKFNKVFKPGTTDKLSAGMLGMTALGIAGYHGARRFLKKDNDVQSSYRIMAGLGLKGHSPENNEKIMWHYLKRKHGADGQEVHDVYKGKKARGRLENPNALKEAQRHLYKIGPAGQLDKLHKRVLRRQQEARQKTLGEKSLSAHFKRNWGRYAGAGLGAAATGYSLYKLNESENKKNRKR